MNQQTEARHVMHQNGAIRLPHGKLIGFYDRQTGMLLIDGKQDGMYAADEETAMDLVAKHYE